MRGATYSVIWDGVCHTTSARDANRLLRVGWVVECPEPCTLEATIAAVDQFRTPRQALSHLASAGASPR